MLLTWNQKRRLEKAIKTSFVLDIRRLIERIERNKDQFKTSDQAAYRELRDVQHELETMNRKLLELFSIKRRNEGS